MRVDRQASAEAPPVIAQAIHWLAPWLLGAQVSTYAQVIDREAAVHRLDPLLVVALAWRESRFHARARSRSGRSWGLLQVRVTRTLHAQWWGRERELLRPAVGIRVGVAILARWRAYHRRVCNPRALRRRGPLASPRHRWHAHYQFGTRVRYDGPGRRVEATYRALKARFGTGGMT